MNTIYMCSIWICMFFIYKTCIACLIRTILYYTQRQPTHLYLQPGKLKARQCELWSVYCIWYGLAAYSTFRRTFTFLTRILFFSGRPCSFHFVHTYINDWIIDDDIAFMSARIYVNVLILIKSENDYAYTFVEPQHTYVKVHMYTRSYYMCKHI